MLRWKKKKEKEWSSNEMSISFYVPFLFYSYKAAHKNPSIALHIFCTINWFGVHGVCPNAEYKSSERFCVRLCLHATSFLWVCVRVCLFEFISILHFAFDFDFDFGNVLCTPLHKHFLSAFRQLMPLFVCVRECWGRAKDEIAHLIVQIVSTPTKKWQKPHRMATAVCKRISSSRVFFPSIMLCSSHSL